MRQQQETPPAQPPPDLPLMQFRLRNLLLAMAVASFLLTLLVRVEGHWKIVLLLVVGSLGGHLAAAAFGHRLRSNSERRRRWREAVGATDPDQSASRIIPGVAVERPALSPLGEDTTRLPWMPLMVALGACLGGAAGAFGLSASIGDRISTAGLMMGAVSIAALGAWFAFVASGFVGISRRAWREAIAGQQRDRERRRQVS